MKEHLTALLETFSKIPTREEFVSAFQTAMEFVAKSELTLSKKIDEKLSQIRTGKDGRDGVDGKSIQGPKGEKGDAGPIGRSIFGGRGESGKDGKDGADGKDGQDVSPETVDELKEEIKKLEGRLGARIDAVPRGAPRAAHSTRFTDLSSQTNGTLKVFNVPEGLSGVLFSSDFPMVLMEGNGFTLNSSRTQLTMTTVTAPTTGSQLLYQSTDIHNI